MPDSEELVNRVFSAHHVREENGKLGASSGDHQLKIILSQGIIYLEPTQVCLLASCWCKFESHQHWTLTLGTFEKHRQYAPQSSRCK